MRTRRCLLSFHLCSVAAVLRSSFATYWLLPTGHERLSVMFTEKVVESGQIRTMGRMKQNSPTMLLNPIFGHLYVGLLQRLGNGESVICTAGIGSEMERRGVAWMDKTTELTTRSMTYQDHVRQIYEDFVHCGSDAVVAYSNLDPDVECQLALQYTRIARGVADRTQTLAAASVKLPRNHTNEENALEAAIKIQVNVAVKMGADFIMCEDFTNLWQAKRALEYIKQFDKDLPIVMTLSGRCHKVTRDGVPLPDALKDLETSGADVVGLGSGVDPVSIITSLKEARKVCKGHLAALPDAYRSLGDNSDDDFVLCTRKDIQEFSRQAKSVGIHFVGLCCGGFPGQTREMAEELGRRPSASKFSPNLSLVCKNIANPTPTQAKRRLHQVTQEYRKFKESC